MDDLLSFDGLTMEMEPAITNWGFEDLQDEPDSHRWRAWWAPGGKGNEVSGIQLQAYPVLKRTPRGVWINATPYRQGVGWEAFDETWMDKKFLLDGAQQAWAKPTQEEAIQSLAIRLTRWAAHVGNSVDRIRSAADALEKLRPGCSSFAYAAREKVFGGSGDV